MPKILAVLTAIITITTVVLGLVAYLGVDGAAKYHLIAGLLTLVAILVATHMLYHGKLGRK